MATCSGPNVQVLLKTSFQESNGRIREKLLKEVSSSNSYYGRLVEKYRKRHDEQNVLSSDSESYRDTFDGDEREEEKEPAWYRLYTNPLLYLETYDDENDSDDGLDGKRATFLAPSSCGEYMKRAMENMLETQNNYIHKDALVDTFLETIQSVKKNRNSIYKVKIKLLNMKEDIYRIVTVPSRISLAMFQEKVLCPVMDWLPNLYNYAFYLSSNKYVNGEKPENPDEDLCMSSVNMVDKTGVVFTIKRGGQHVVDDRKVALFQVLHSVHDSLYYKHGSQKHEGKAVPYKITVLDIEPTSSADELSMKDIRVTCGRGPVPGETGAAPEWCYEENAEIYPGINVPTDYEILGVKAFSISISILQQREAHEKWTVKEAMKHLRVSDAGEFDISSFDIAAARKRVREMAQQFSIKRGTMSPMEAFSSIFPGTPPPNLGRKEKCLSCGREEHTLGPGNKLMRCSRCKSACYCGADCQRNDWKVHKSVCVKHTKQRK